MHKIDFNTSDYIKEEDSGYLYKKKITFNENTFDLIGSGSYYPHFRLLYSMGLYVSSIKPLQTYIETNTSHPLTILHQELLNVILTHDTNLIVLKMYREISILYFIKHFKSILIQEINQTKHNYTDKEYIELMNQVDFVCWIFKKNIKKDYLNKHDEIYFIYYENGIVELFYGESIPSDNFIENVISQNTVPVNQYKKIGKIENQLLSKLLFLVYVNNKIITNLKMI